MKKLVSFLILLFSFVSYSSEEKLSIDHSDRIALVEEILANGAELQAKSVIELEGRQFLILNDHLKTEDGLYVPMTFVEARRIANAWGYQIPTAKQLKQIAELVEIEGNQFLALTRKPNNGPKSQFESINAMINDSRMHERALRGDEVLIDGHFKWYIDQGKIYGFARGGGRFWQNRPSGAHIKDPGYFDYSHGVRLIKELP